MNEEIDIKALLGPIRRRVKLIAAIVFATVLFAGLIGISLTPIFRASTLVYVDTNQQSLLDENVSISNSAADNSMVTSEVEIVKSDGVILKLIDRLNLVQDTEFGARLSRMDKIMTVLGLSQNTQSAGDVAVAGIINRLKDAISVQRRGQTYIISISADSEDPKKAALLANELASAYIESQLASKVQNIEVSLAAVQRQTAETETRYLAAQTALNDFIANNLDAIARANPEVDFEELQTQLSQLQERKETDLIKRSLVLGELNDIPEIDDIQVEAFLELKAQRDRLSDQIAANSLRSLTSEELKQQLSQIDNELESGRANIVSIIDGTILQTDNDISKFQVQLNDKVLDSEINVPVEIRPQLLRLVQQNTNNKSQYDTLSERSSELGAESLLQIPDSRVISEAIVPTAAVSPNLKLILAVALILGLGLGVGVAFIIENFVGGLVEIDQLEALTGTALTTSIRKFSRSVQPDERSVSDRVVSQPLSHFSESLRKLRTSIQIALSKKGKKQASDEQKLGTVVMVSSSVPSEGKSTISTSLARTMAFSGVKTLIIDCDIRKPSLASHLGPTEKKGLVNLFAGPVNTNTLMENVELDELTNLHAILCSRNDLRDSQFTMGFRPFEKIIETARKQYDFIILDTPPVGPVADALTLASLADLIVFVVKWASTPQKMVKESVNLLGEIAPDKPILSVLNQFEGDSGTPYQSYAGYYSDE